MGRLRTSIAMVGGDFARRRRIAGAERPLHQDRIGPMAELEADSPQQTGAFESERVMQVQRRLIGRVDVADHLPVSGVRAGVDQRRKQQPTDAGVKMILMHVNRMFHGIAIGGTFQKRNGIGIANDAAMKIRHDVGKTAFEHGFAPPLDVVWMQGLRLKIAETILNMMGVDADHGRDVQFGRSAHDDRERLIKHIRDKALNSGARDRGSVYRSSAGEDFMTID
jgi:hypothetical protein